MASLTRIQKVAEAAARIFGTHVGNGLQSGRKELRRNLAGPTLTSWYVRPIGKTIDPLVGLDTTFHSRHFASQTHPIDDTSMGGPAGEQGRGRGRGGGACAGA